MARAPTIHGPRTFVTVSHDAHAVRSPGDTAVLIDRGEVRASRPAHEVVDAYGASSLGEGPGASGNVSEGTPGEPRHPGRMGSFRPLNGGSPPPQSTSSCKRAERSLRPCDNGTDPS